MDKQFQLWKLQHITIFVEKWKFWRLENIKKHSKKQRQVASRSPWSIDLIKLKVSIQLSKVFERCCCSSYVFPKARIPFSSNFSQWINRSFLLFRILTPLLFSTIICFILSKIRKGRDETSFWIKILCESGLYSGGNSKSLEFVIRLRSTSSSKSSFYLEIAFLRVI